MIICPWTSSLIVLVKTLAGYLTKSVVCTFRVNYETLLLIYYALVSCGE